MIAFGLSVSEGAAYHLYAEPGIERAREPDSEVFVFATVGVLARTYNLLLDAAAAHDDLEALVLVHPHTEILDDAFCHTVRRALADDDVAVVGAAGAGDVRTIAWWEGDISSGRVTQRYQDHGGGEAPAYSWTTTNPAPAEVDTVDGFLIVLSPWAVRHVRFDEALALGHGFELDYCLQVREAGRKVVTADIEVRNHRGLELVEESEIWIEAHIQLADKWEGKMPGAERHPEPTEEQWKRRARRAEAQREAARSMAYGTALGLDARILGLQTAMREATASRGWRLTAPLRRLNHWRTQRARARSGG